MPYEKHKLIIYFLESHYLYYIVALSKGKINEKSINKICRNLKPKWINHLDKELDNVLNHIHLINKGSNDDDDNKNMNKIEIINNNSKIKIRNRKEEDLIICEGILSMDMNSHYNTTKNNFSNIVIPLNLLNVTSLIILFVLILFGSYYVWKILTRKKCLCKVCRGNYKMVEKLSEGGFGEVNKKIIFCIDLQSYAD
jgi:hypothetical protein